MLVFRQFSSATRQADRNRRYGDGRGGRACARWNNRLSRVNVVCRSQIKHRTRAQTEAPVISELFLHSNIVPRKALSPSN